MKKTRYLIIVTVLTAIMYLSETSVYADVAPDPVELAGGPLVVVGLVVVVLAVAAWLIIRSIKKK